MRKYFAGIFTIIIFLVLSPACAKSIRPESDEVTYWNLNKTLRLRIEQRLSKNRKLDVSLIDGTKEISLSYILTHSSSSNFSINISYPTLQPLPYSDTLSLVIKYHGSRKELTRITVVPDYHPPQIEIISQTETLKQGGSALVVFYAEDENIKNIYIKDNTGKIFHPSPFMEKDYYVSLLVWFIPYTRYSAVLYAEDYAGNISETNLTFNLERTKIPVSILTVNPDFVSSKKEELGLESDTKEDKSGYDEVNKKLAQKSVVNIAYLTSYVSPGIFTNRSYQAWMPLPKYRITSEFGKLRKYQYQGVITKESYHFGLDIAHVKNSPIYTSNPAKVAFADYNGGYGNTLVLDHGIGLYSMYGHCHKLLVTENQEVSPGKNVAISGTTGYSTGDHVHFSIIIQGIYADPQEWMDQKWVDKNINVVLSQARRNIALRSYENLILSLHP